MVDNAEMTNHPLIAVEIARRPEAAHSHGFSAAYMAFLCARLGGGNARPSVVVGHCGKADAEE
jgi:hypothetical protein